MFRNLTTLSAIAGLLFCGPLNASGERLQGRVIHIRDIDTIVVEGVPVRLNGLDGPELSEPMGQEAKVWLVELLTDTVVSCDLTGAKTYDRMVGTCYLPNGTDLAQIIISKGFGRDCPRYSGGKYAPFETPNSKKHKVHSYCKKK